MRGEEEAVGGERIRQLEKKGKFKATKYQCNVRAVQSKPTNMPFGKKKLKKPFFNPSTSLAGGPSWDSRPDPIPVCGACAEPKPEWRQWLSFKDCSHAYCTDCSAKHVASELKDNNITRVGCPVTGCVGYLDPDGCSRILPRDVLQRWGSALAAIRGGSHQYRRRFLYCPYRDCTTGMTVGEWCTEVECWKCLRMVCSKCEVPWHSGITCSLFQRRNEEEEEDCGLFMLAAAHNHSRYNNKFNYRTERFRKRKMW